jgi:hypothetical protein
MLEELIECHSGGTGIEVLKYLTSRISGTVASNFVDESTIESELQRACRIQLRGFAEKRRFKPSFEF